MVNIKLSGKIKVKEYEFCEKHYCNEGFMIYNEKGENFVLCWDDYQQCCEWFTVHDFLGNDIMEFESENGCEIIEDTVTEEENTELMDMYGGYDYTGTDFVLFSIRANGEEKHRFIIINEHNGYYAHTVCYGKEGNLIHTEL